MTVELGPRGAGGTAHLAHRAGRVAAGPGCKGRLLRHRVARLLLPPFCRGHRLLGILGPTRCGQEILARRWPSDDRQFLLSAWEQIGGGGDGGEGCRDGLVNAVVDMQNQGSQTRRS